MSTETDKSLAVGDVVKFVTPANEAEVAARFTVVELRGPRVLIRLHRENPNWLALCDCVELAEVERVGG